VSYFQNVENVGATELIKDEAKITLKTAIKAKNVLTKMLKDFVGNKRNETNVFQLCCGKGKNYVGYVGLVGKTLFENYVEMVAGLPRTNKK
jgi:hypothetical protein